MNDFTTVYETTAGRILTDSLLPIAIGILFLVCGVGWMIGALWAKRSTSEGMSVPSQVCALATVMSFIWLIFRFERLISAFAGLAFALAAPDIDGSSQVTEGVVHVVHLQQPRVIKGRTERGLRSTDLISVEGRNFEFGYFLCSPGYKQTVVYGGALREGVYARLRHYGGVILKVEVRTPTETGKTSP